jgi:hypothetical protein
VEEPVSNLGPFRVRFRFRLQKKLNIQSKEHRLTVSGHDVVLSAPLPDVDISDSEWLVMNATGFGSEADARSFGRKLKAACEVSSVAGRLGLDAGVDLSTSGFGKLIKDQVREQAGVLLRDNVHGIDVFADDPNVRIAHISATGTVLSAPEPFLTDVDRFHGVAANASQRAADIVLLMNYALMRPEPVAQIVFAVSAVEMLGQDEKWSTEQGQLLAELADAAEKAAIGTAEERREVAEAIRKGTHKLSLRQGVLRLLTSLGLGDLKKEWDELYKERSTLVHGLAPKPGADYSDLAFRTVGLCGKILLTAVSREVPGANSHVDQFYWVRSARRTAQ